MNNLGSYNFFSLATVANPTMIMSQIVTRYARSDVIAYRGES